MSLAEFAEFAGELVLDNGRRMALYPEQELMLGDYFDGVRETLILIGKKAGKTHLCAALTLYHLITTPDAEVVVAATSRDQATILYDAARGLVRRTPALRDLIDTKRGYREPPQPGGRWPDPRPGRRRGPDGRCPPDALRDRRISPRAQQ